MVLPELQPRDALVDTYDTLDGVRAVIALAREKHDFRVAAVRLDSGELGRLARDARRLLDAAGLEEVRIVASGGLDESGVAGLLASGAPIDGFGVGTRMVVSEDAPSIDLAYKLVAYTGEPRMKFSEGKVHHPGRKQVHRFSRGGRFDHDVLARFDEDIPGGEPLLRRVMRDGRRLPAGEVSLEDSRAHAAGQLRRLPDPLRSLSPAAEPYDIRISRGVEEGHQRVGSRADEASGP